MDADANAAAAAYGLPALSVIATVTVNEDGEQASIAIQSFERHCAAVASNCQDASEVPVAPDVVLELLVDQRSAATTFE